MMLVEEPVKLIMSIFIGGIIAASVLANDHEDDIYAPQPMVPNPIEQTQNLGRPEGMAIYPADPVPGHPGADPAEGRNPWSHPQRLPYEGSVEHWRVWTPHYIQPIAPFNHRTLLRNFPAQQMDGVADEMRETWAEPIQYVIRTGPPTYTGEFRDPVPVVRLKPGGDRISFSLDPLPTGMYAVRLIAAIETENHEGWGENPNDMIISMTINDGFRGAVNEYVLRQRGTDSFYSMGEFFFHVEDARAWEISLGLHEDSDIDLLVHNVDVHDMLAETAKRAGKTRSINAPMHVLEARWQTEEAERARQGMGPSNQRRFIDARLNELREQFDLPEEEIWEMYRAERDEIIWNMLPPKNFNYNIRGQALPSITDPQTWQQLLDDGIRFEDDRSYDAVRFIWRLDRESHFMGNHYHALTSPWRLFRETEDGEREYYTLEDLRAQKPLPGLPFDLYPWGKSFDLGDGKKALFYPIAEAVNHNFWRVMAICRTQASNPWVSYGDEVFSHDLALMLVRLAYELPGYIESRSLNYQFGTRGGYFSRDTIAHQFRRWAYQGIEWEHLAEQYDRLFHFIEGNQELADSVNRFIKWVETPDDVIALLDTYILQYGARETLYFRHYYNHQHSRMLANFAAIQTDPEIAEPWVRSMFEWTWEYPHPYGSVEDFMYLGTQRDGTQTIGSSFYAGGGSAIGSAAPLVDEYIAEGGDPQYKLSDVNLYPRVAQFPFWLMESRVAGLHPLHVGDVGGPTTAYAQWFSPGSEQMNLGWRWSKDPRFAWAVANHGQRRTETDEEWAELLEAAATVERNPFISNRTRILADWGAILEGNAESDDFRERSAARIRIGVGSGHAHSDTLDLGLWSHGLTMAGDMGARGGYGRPDSKGSFLHNLVTIDKSDWMGQAWTRELSDLDGLQYTNVDTLRGGHYSRQVALIDLDDAYVVDFARTIGGREHSYNFHGPTEDQFEVNVERGGLAEADTAWLQPYVIDGEQWAADIDQDVFKATWRMAREPLEFTVPGRGERRSRAPEPHILGNAYDENGPRKFLCVHVPGQRGQRVRSGVAVTAPYGAGRTDGDWLRRMHVIREADGGQASSLFAAVWEPFEGESFITDVRMEGDPADARGYAAIHVQTENGRNDIIFSDAVDSQMRTLVEDNAQIHGGFAYISRDDEGGLSQASLIGGNSLVLPELRIETVSPAHEARVTGLDYINNIATLDRELPGILAGRFFEVGTDAQGASGARWSNFEAASVDGDSLVWRKGADGGTGLIEEITRLADNDELLGQWRNRGATEDHAILNLRMNTGMVSGRNSQVALMKGHDGPYAVADVHGQNILLKSEDVEKLGLEPEDRIRLFEIAVGDVFRTNTQVSLARLGNLYRVTSDVPCSIRINAEQASWSIDGNEWHELPAAEYAGFRIMEVTDEIVSQGGHFYLRW